MSFYGENLKDAEYDLIAFSNIQAKHLKHEVTVSQTKWFDYRDWHHIKATYYFAYCFEQAYKKFFERTRDIRIAKEIKAFKHEDVMQTLERTNVHLARLSFDAIGVRYEFGINFLMQRFIQRGWTKMPRPNQIYGEAMLLDLKDAWNEECRARLQVPKNPIYKAENFVGSLLQTQFHDWLELQIRRRTYQYMTLGQAVYVEKIMPESEAIKRFGEELVTRAKKDSI